MVWFHCLCVAGWSHSLLWHAAFKATSAGVKSHQLSRSRIAIACPQGLIWLLDFLSIEKLSSSRCTQCFVDVGLVWTAVDRLGAFEVCLPALCHWDVLRDIDQMCAVPLGTAVTGGVSKTACQRCAAGVCFSENYWTFEMLKSSTVRSIFATSAQNMHQTCALCHWVMWLRPV